MEIEEIWHEYFEDDNYLHMTVQFFPQNVVTMIRRLVKNNSGSGEFTYLWRLRCENSCTNRPW